MRSRPFQIEKSSLFGGTTSHFGEATSHFGIPKTQLSEIPTQQRPSRSSPARPAQPSAPAKLRLGLAALGQAFFSRGRKKKRNKMCAAVWQILGGLELVLGSAEVFLFG